MASTFVRTMRNRTFTTEEPPIKAEDFNTRR
jgi:hypothetical protein